MPDMAIGTALKLLEREGYIRRSQDKVGNAYLKTLKTEKEIKDLLGSRAKIQNEVFDKLYKKYQVDLVKGFDFNFDALASILEINKDSLRRLIKKLETEGAVEYKPPFKGTEINILKRVPKHEVKLDFDALKYKLKHAYKKLDKIEDYVFHFACRPKYILDYFGDLEVADCGKCDNCLANNSADEIFSDEFTQENNKPIKHKEKLATKLTQLETFDLYNAGKSIDEMAQIRNLKPATIVEHLVYLIEKGLPVSIDKFVSKDKQLKIERAIKKVGKEKLSPIKDALGDVVNWDEIELVLAKIKHG
jgi:ATP-dependent DNA helicase RecQ